MKVRLPNGEYLEWTVDREGNPGTNGDEEDKIQLIWVTQRRPTMATELLKLKQSMMTSSQSSLMRTIEDHRVSIWRMSKLVEWIIRKVSDEKLVLHKLSE